MESGSKVRLVPVLTRRQELTISLRKLLPHVDFREVHPEENEDDFDILKNSEIIIGDPNRICPFLYKLPAARWIQGTWAGVDVYEKYIDRNKPKLPFTITRFSGPSFGTLMGEYVISQIIVHERDFFRIHQNQLSKSWLRNGNIVHYRALADLSIGILGFGALGKEIARLLKSFNVNVWALVRSIPGEIGKQPCVDEYRRVDELPELLSACDYICNILPSTDDTKGLLGNGMLKNCNRKKTILMNIGRGSIISEKDLLEALNENWIAGAILDVFEDEPLPLSSPLWTMNQVTITPHVSGVVRQDDLAKLFTKNLKLYESGQPLEYVYDTERGY